MKKFLYGRYLLLFFAYVHLLSVGIKNQDNFLIGTSIGLLICVYHSLWEQGIQLQRGE